MQSADTVAPRHDQSGAPEYSEVSGDARLIERETRGEFAGASLPPGEDAHDRDADRVSERVGDAGGLFILSGRLFLVIHAFMHLNANITCPGCLVKGRSPGSRVAVTIVGMQIGLSLGSGGAKGYAHIGVIRALEEAGIRIASVNGSSIGAVVGGAYALYHDVDEITELVDELVRTMNVDFFNLFRYGGERHSYLQNFLLNAFCDLSALRESILSHRTNQRALDFLFGDHTFDDTKIPFSAVACDLLTGESIVLDEGRLLDGILPSIAIPGIFPPVARDDRLLVDGGVLAEVPVRELRARGVSFVIGSRLHPDPLPPCRNGFSLLTLADALKERRLCEWTLDGADAAIDVVLPGVDASRFEAYEKAIEIGYRTTRDKLPEILEKVASADE